MDQILFQGAYRIPAIVKSKTGTLMAFAEDRTEGVGDSGCIRLVMRRSLDGGTTWLPKQIIWDNGHVAGNKAETKRLSRKKLKFTTNQLRITLLTGTVIKPNKQKLKLEHFEL